MEEEEEGGGEGGGRGCGRGRGGALIGAEGGGGTGGGEQHGGGAGDCGAMEHAAPCRAEVGRWGTLSGFVSLVHAGVWGGAWGEGGRIANCLLFGVITVRPPFLSTSCCRIRVRIRRGWCQTRTARFGSLHTSKLRVLH